MKVECFRDEPCEKCEPHFISNDEIQIGDILTVSNERTVGDWLLYQFYECPVADNGWWCSCCFRPLGDPDAWKDMLKRHKSKPKTPELEPA